MALNVVQNAGYSRSSPELKHTGFWAAYSHSHFDYDLIQSKKFSLFGLSRRSIIPNRFSYFMDWSGPSLLVDTLCSSSLVAVHQAIESIRSNMCQQAVVASVNAGLSPYYFSELNKLNALSLRGQCETFGQDCDGYVPGEGVAAIMLKRLENAKRDNNTILAIIKGSAINHCGQTSRFLAPNPQKESDVITSALKNANLSPEDIHYVESHGTGTPVGDVIEIEAIAKIFSNNTNPIILGALKPYIGHLEAASGLAALQKAITIGQQNKAPALTHLNRISTKLEPYLSSVKLPRSECTICDTTPMIGVNAFGMGGTNAHVILQGVPSNNVELEPDKLHPFIDNIHYS